MKTNDKETAKQTNSNDINNSNSKNNSKARTILIFGSLSISFIFVIVSMIYNLNDTNPNTTIDTFGKLAVMFIASLYCVLIVRDHIRNNRLSTKLQNTIELATKDTLTGILNRAAFDLKVRELKEMVSSEADSPFVVVMIDLNDLKYINDHYGHVEGDQYLVNCCNLIRDIIPSEIYRIGGDEFVLVLEGDLFKNWEDLYNKLRISVAKANMKLIPDSKAPSIAIGIAVHEVGKGMDVDELLKIADTKMYEDKVAIKQARLTHSEKGYYEDVKLRLIDKQILIDEINKGLLQEEFEVWFQPQVNHDNKGALIGAEALVRWNHPKRGMVSPAVFIPILEYNGLIYELDKYVWRHTCDFLRTTIKNGINQLPLSVNVSRYDLIQEDFIETIISIVEEYEIPYDLLHLEVTESAFSDDSGEIVKTVNELINRGFIIAIDDFGSGYSSLSLLRGVSANIVKLDMRFFTDDENKQRNECIIESTIRMVKMLGMSVLAEGVETVDIADNLRTLGCAYIQGYLYSKPLPIKEFLSYAKNSVNEKIHHENSKIGDELDAESSEAKTMYHNIISGTNEVVFVADSITKKLLYANRAAESFYGKRFDPINPVTCEEYCNRGEMCTDCPAMSLASGERRELYKIEDGKHIKSLYTKMDWNGHDAFVCYQSDISAQMKELEFSDALIRNMPGATIALELGQDNLPKIIYLSDNAMKVFAMAGVTKTDPTYEDVYSVMHPDDRKKVRKAADLLFIKNESFREAFRVILANGKTMWVDLWVNPVADRDGKYLYYGIFTDITASKNEQDRVDEVLQSIPAAIAIYEITKTDTTRIFISDRAKELLSMPGDAYERFEATQLYNRVHEHDRRRVIEITQECFKLGKPFSLQFRIIPKEGEILWLQLDSQPIASSNESDVKLFYSIYTDITTKKQLEINAGLAPDKNVLKNIIDFGLQEAMKQSTPELTIDYIIRFVGRVLHGERAYIFEMNPDKTNSNTFEWVADGIVPEMENLQNLPEELSKPWYDQFKKKNVVIIEDLEEIKFESPDLYEALKVQDIQSLVVAPVFDSYGNPMGFFGIDNPPKELLIDNSNLVQTIAYYIEAAIKRKNLNKNLNS